MTTAVASFGVTVERVRVALSTFVVGPALAGSDEPTAPALRIAPAQDGAAHEEHHR